MWENDLKSGLHWIIFILALQTIIQHRFSTSLLMFAQNISRTNQKNSLEKLFPYRFLLHLKKLQCKVFTIFTSAATCIDSLSFSDKLDSTQIQNFLHKFIHIYDVLSVSVFGIKYLSSEVLSRKYSNQLKQKNSF